MYRPAIVNLANVDELLAPTDGELFGVGLAEKGLVSGLYCIHGVARPQELCAEVADAGGAAHFEDTMGDAETESWKKEKVAHVSGDHKYDLDEKGGKTNDNGIDIPGGREFRRTTVPETLAVTSP